MPRAQAIPTQMRADIEHLIIIEKQSHSAVLNWLATRGVHCDARTLKRYCRKWNISRQAPEEVVSFIDTEFHTTLHDDSTIARHLNERGFSVSARQVRRIRTAQGWKHRTRDSEERQQNWSETFHRVGQALAEGTVRSYGREMVQSNLRREQGYRAREDDVRNALKLQDPAGTETRKPGTKRKRRLEYIVPGPNFLWSIDGHDKLASYGIEMHCEKFNPSLAERQASVKPEKRHPSVLPGPEDDILCISDDSPPKQLSSPPPRLPTRSAQHIPSLMSGVGEKARRDSAAATSKIKAGYNLAPDSFHFLIGVAHYNPTVEKWKKAPTNWMKAEGNRTITSEALLQSLLAKVRLELDRSAYKQWLTPTQSGNWLLCHQITQ